MGYRDAWGRPAATFSIGGSLQREYKNKAEGRERLQAVGEKHQRASVRKCGRMPLVRRAIRTVEPVMRARVQMELRVVSTSEAFRAYIGQVNDRSDVSSTGTYPPPAGVYLNFWPAKVAAYMRPPLAIVNTCIPF